MNAAHQQQQAQVRRIGDSQLDGSVARALLAQSPACIKVLDRDGRLTYMSANGLAVMQIDDFAAVAGQFWWSLWPEPSRDMLRNAVAAAARGVSVSFDAACPTPSGIRQWHVGVSPITGGALDGMILAQSRDISEQVAETTALHSLEAENAALRHFTRLVAHDLRGPIRQQKLLAEELCTRLQTQNADSETQWLIDELRNASGSMLSMLGSLENLHRCQQPPVRAALFLPDVLAAAHACVGTDTCDLIIDSAADLPHIDADAGQMLLALVCLLENAVKFCPRGTHPRIAVALRQTDSRHVELILKDNGPGFANDRRDEVFQPFVRQSNAAATSGSGIGLAIVDRVVTGHGGSVILHPHVADTPATAIRIILPRDEGILR